MTARFIDAFGRPAADPHPDDFCRWCGGRGAIQDYDGHGYRLVTTCCPSCGGTGWSGLRHAPPPTDEERTAACAAMEDEICRAMQ